MLCISISLVFYLCSLCYFFSRYDVVYFFIFHIFCPSSKFAPPLFCALCFPLLALISFLCFLFNYFSSIFLFFLFLLLSLSRFIRSFIFLNMFPAGRVFFFYGISLSSVGSRLRKLHYKVVQYISKHNNK